jgi:hypothetical protein
MVCASGGCRSPTADRGLGAVSEDALAIEREVPALNGQSVQNQRGITVVARDRSVVTAFGVDSTDDHPPLGRGR